MWREELSDGGDCRGFLLQPEPTNCMLLPFHNATWTKVEIFVLEQWDFNILLEFVHTDFLLGLLEIMDVLHVLHHFTNGRRNLSLFHV